MFVSASILGSNSLPMSFRARPFALSTLAALLFASCSDKNASGYNPEVGPFDENGNYVEAWADNPPKRSSWRKSSTSSKPKTAVPSKKDPEVAPTPPVSRPTPAVVKVSTPRPAPRPEPKPVAKPAPKPKPKPVVKPTPKPKPKPAPVKAKPAFKYHTVAKGETLYSLAQKYKVTVRGIQQANSISGTNIRIGQSIKIPVK